MSNRHPEHSNVISAKAMPLQNYRHSRVGENLNGPEKRLQSGTRRLNPLQSSKGRVLQRSRESRNLIPKDVLNDW